MGSTIKGAILGAVGTILVAVAVWLAVVYAGAYNVAATDRHFDAVRWSFDTTMRRSIAGRAEEIRLPERFPDNIVAEGARHYAGTCAHCHGAPGQEPSAWSRGMRPEPPRLVEAASEWSPEEIFWIVQNGIKMTGMPAFGPRHGREELTAITAFVTKLPGLSPEDYRAMTEGSHGHGNSPASGQSH